MSTLFKLNLVKCIFSSTKPFYTVTLNGILKSLIFLSLLFLLTKTITICQMSLWEPRSGTLLIKIRGHEDSVNEVQFYPVISSKSVPIIFSVGDNSCRVWHPLRKRGKQLQMIKQHRLGLEVCLLFQVIIFLQ